MEIRRRRARRSRDHGRLLILHQELVVSYNNAAPRAGHRVSQRRRQQELVRARPLINCSSNEGPRADGIDGREPRRRRGLVEHVRARELGERRVPAEAMTVFDDFCSV